MEEFVLFPLSHYLELTSSVSDMNSTTADTTSRFTTHQTHYPNAPNSEPDVTFEKQSNSSEEPPAAEKEWLKGIVEPSPESKTEKESEKDLQKTQHELSIRRKRVQGLIDLMISTRGIRFNKSNATFSFTSNNLAHETPTSSIKILQFLRDLQQYRKKVPQEYFLVLNILFPPTKAISLKRANDLVINRNCLSYITNQNVHTQRMQ